MRFRALQSSLTALLLPFLAIAPSSPAANVREAPEYTVKAAYLLLFTRYVEWPSNAFASPTAPIEILVLGDDPFGEVLDSTLAGMKSNGRPITARRAQTLGPGERAHLAFFGHADADLRKQWLAQLREGPVLTVVNEPDKLRPEAVLTFVTETRRGEGHVRFDVNLIAMRRAGIRIDSRMLAAARRLVREPVAQEVRR